MTLHLSHLAGFFVRFSDSQPTSFKKANHAHLSKRPVIYFSARVGAFTKRRKRRKCTEIDLKAYRFPGAAMEHDPRDTLGSNIGTELTQKTKFKSSLVSSQILRCTHRDSKRVHPIRVEESATRVSRVHGRHHPSQLGEADHILELTHLGSRPHAGCSSDGLHKTRAGRV